jgi:photosystem II stability/assembly factor-like uncharacterized protein
VDPTNTAHWYIGAAGGGIWETTDSGATWVSRTDNQASLAIGAIAIASGNPNLIYAGTGEGNFSGDSFAGQGMLKSTDGGHSWTQKIVGQGTGVAVDPTNFNNQYAAIGDLFGNAANGIYRSTDAGNTWTLVSGPWTGGAVGRIAIAIAPSNPNVMYVGISSSGPFLGSLL